MWTSLWRSVSVKGNKKEELVNYRGRCAVRGHFCVLQRKKIIEQPKRKERVFVDGFEASAYGKQGAHSRLCGCSLKQSMQTSLRHLVNPSASATPQSPTYFLTNALEFRIVSQNRQMASSHSLSLSKGHKLRTQHHKGP